MFKWYPLENIRNGTYKVTLNTDDPVAIERTTLPGNLAEMESLLKVILSRDKKKHASNSGGSL